MIGPVHKFALAMVALAALASAARGQADDPSGPLLRLTRICPSGSVEQRLVCLDRAIQALNFRLDEMSRPRVRPLGPQAQ